MADFPVAEFFRAIACPLLAGLLVSALLDLGMAAAHGKAGVRDFLRRPWQAWVIHLAIMTTLFNVELLVFQRPWFAFSQMLTLQVVVLIVSVMKNAMLREPFVYQDFSYFTDMLRHPRLYIPFFGYTNLAALLAVVAVVIYLGIRFEPGMLEHMALLPFVAIWLLFQMAVSGVLRLTRHHDFQPSFDPAQDIARLGMMASLAAYARAEKIWPEFTPRFSTLRRGAGELPNIVAVQSESFFDARHVYADIQPDIYAWLDKVAAASAQYGRAEVPAWGANTVRTEFAFLSGRTAEELGVHRFNPYRQMARHGVESVAQYLRTQGYRTVCVHPYVARFYERDMVLPMLGFDELIDINAFSATDYAGPYVGDVAVADKVAVVLAESAAAQQPVFIHVITMENHGPLHLEKVSKDDKALTYTGEQPPGFHDLTVYLRHIRNAGSMCEKLQASLSAQARAGVLGWYGDHVPILPKVYKRCKYQDARTDYFIWRTRGETTSSSAAVDIAVTELAHEMLQHAGWKAG